ncbi:uncharacterized protein LOC125235946 isoform X2 [Leguminivora glycinivorella]|uniref:uncharacterized protein LOC125235946 isoform X2 n=1 Tax=Leguminivora glycinivorella TaxID=1035111 RepID=UPI00200CB261|nr:uncharacterized protein LOC125235946 isoform X2 [Leguminivora glycinivorella]
MENFFTFFATADDETFENSYRVSRNTFEILFNLIENIIKKNDTHFRDCISAKERFAICLKFPKCPNMKEIWINATKRSDDWFPSPSSVVCSRHFKSEYFKLTKGNRRILSTNAVPTLHLPTVIPGDGTVAQSPNTFSEVAKVTQTLPTAEICHEASQYQSSVTMNMEVEAAVLPMPLTEVRFQATLYSVFNL